MNEYPKLHLEANIKQVAKGNKNIKQEPENIFSKAFYEERCQHDKRKENYT